MAGSKFDGALGRLGADRKPIAASGIDANKRLPGRPKGKSSNPDYERLTVLLPKTLRKAVARKWEDTNPERDMSDLVQILFEQFMLK